LIILVAGLAGVIAGFIDLVMLQVFEFCMKKPKEEALALADKIGVKLTAEDKDNQEKQLMKVIRC